MNPVLLGPTAIRDLPQIDAGVPLSRIARDLLPSCTDPPDFLRRLVAEGLDGDALRLFPYLVPVRLSIWWACLCSWHGRNNHPGPSDDAVFRAVVHWVQAPSERHANDAETAARGDKLETAGGFCARAVVWAGFLASAEGPWKTVDPRAAAKMSAGCAFLAVSEAQDAGVPVDYRQFLRLALAVADGNVDWESKEGVRT